MREFKFITPCDGDMLSNVSGTLKKGTLLIEVVLSAPENSAVSVNGITARKCGDTYKAEIPLNDYQNTITAKCNDTEERITVFWLKNAANKFSFSVDDNIWVFADLTKNQDKYDSIFDNPYLAVYKKAHDLYGTKVRLNVFYEIDNECGIAMYGNFNLSMMTEKFKNEFRANSHWLHLAFHARSEFPDDPYNTATGEDFKLDFEDVRREIFRFADKECFEWVTTNHFGSGNRDVIRTERELGIKGLMGFLSLDANGKPFVSYYLTKEDLVHANEYGFWKDRDMDMVFGKLDIVLNLMDAPTARKILDRVKADHPKKGAIEVMIHEQYFYPSYSGYLPDFAERVLSACAWCRENGYEPSFATDMIGE